MELNTIREGCFVIDIKLDDEEELLGVSLKTETTEESIEEVIWMEIFDKDELSINVSPDIEGRTEYTQDLWAVLYCISANLRREEEEIWGGLNTSEIAEKIYDSRVERNDYTEELENEIRWNLGELEEVQEEVQEEDYYVIPEEELPEELILDIELETLMDMLKEYGEEESIVVVDFVNRLAELNGFDIQLGVTTVNLETGEESEPEFYLGDGISKEGYVEPVGSREKHGLLEQDYVIMNSTAIVENLLSERELDKEAITFLNQIIFERIQIEKLIEAIFPEE